MKLFISLTIALSGVALSAFPQSNFDHYFDESSISVFNLEPHLNIKFKWNMTGEIQLYMNEGLNYLGEGNLDLAVNNFDEVIVRDSLSWLALYYRGICYRKLLNYKSAERDLVKAKRIKPDQAEIYVELGEIYHESYKNYGFDFKGEGKAARLYKKAIEIDPLLVNAYYNLGITELQSGDSRKAQKLFQKCIEINPKFPDAYVTLGILKFKESRKNIESLNLFNDALKADSAFTQAYIWRGLLHISAGRNEMALQDWSNLIRFNPNNVFMLVMRGFLYIEMNRFDEAFTDLRKSFLSKELDSERFRGGQTILDKQIDLQAATRYIVRNGYGLKDETFRSLKAGYCYLLAARNKEAIEMLKKAEQMEASATVLFLEAIAFEHLNDHQTAFEYYTKTLSLDNDIFDAHKKRSIYYMELKDWKSANTDFNEMIRLQPESMITYRLRGFAKGNQGNYYGAIIDLTKVINSDSSDEESIRSRSRCRLMVDDKKGANDDLRMIIKLTPEYWHLTQEVGLNYLTLNDTANALKVFHEFKQRVHEAYQPRFHLLKIYIAKKMWDSARSEVNPLIHLVEDYPKVHSTVSVLDGLISYGNAFFEEAIAKFTKALDIDPSNVEARYYRAKAYQQIGQRKKCLSDLKAILNSGYLDSQQLYNTLSQQR